MYKRNIQAVERLYNAILTLKSSEECALFFEDICTIQELETFAQRLEVAENLSKGKSYQEVNKITGASTATISRVGKCINYGAGGYKMVIDRLSEVE
ncbi:MAG: hypothetical protein IJO73_08520 [Clostridia bacterium]|nr:hypothetical protein [Clostridia bacterium]